MALNILQKIILRHIEPGSRTGIPAPGERIAVKIDQTLTQDATGTLAYLQFESLGFEAVKTKLSVSYVDHNTLQTGFENADDHRFLRSMAAKYGIIYSPCGNGICHQLHLENFACPGQTLLGSDSHTPTCGGLGMLAMGAGGLDVACALAGRPFHLKMPEVVNIVLKGRLPQWVSAKDVILKLLRDLTVKGGVGKVFEYSGDGLDHLSVYQRATIANMGTELGLTSSVFPSDEVARKFMALYGRPKGWKSLCADRGAEYSDRIEIDLSKIVPMAACPHSPDNVKDIKEIEGRKISQVCIGSCTNSSYDDLIMAALVLKGHGIHPDVDLVISPGSRQVVSILESTGMLKLIIDSGARMLEPCCGPCIGMGQAPAGGGVTLRTFNRNFRNRSGTSDAEVYLCSPETAIASAVKGAITDPRGLKPVNVKAVQPKKLSLSSNFIYPPKKKAAKNITVVRGSNIAALPELEPAGNNISGSVLLKLEDNISTDGILPAGAKILPLRSNIPAISEYAFSKIDPSFVKRAGAGKGIIIAGENYGQGSSREHAALVVKFLGVDVIIAKSFARIHYANLVNFGILPLIFESPSDYDAVSQGDNIELGGIHAVLGGALAGPEFKDGSRSIKLKCLLTEEEKNIVKAGGLLNYIKSQK